MSDLSEHWVRSWPNSPLAKVEHSLQPHGWTGRGRSAAPGGRICAQAPRGVLHPKVASAQAQHPKERRKSHLLS